MFEFESMRIRPVEEADLAWLKSLRNDPSTWQNLLSIEPLTEVGQEIWFKSIASNRSSKPFIAEAKTTNGYITVGFVRTAEIDQLNRSIQIGADVHPDYRGCGYGTKIYNLMLKYCFDFLNVHRVWLFVLETNERAKRLYKKVGFIEEGVQREAVFRDGRYVDHLMMSILEDEWRAK